MLTILVVLAAWVVFSIMVALGLGWLIGRNPSRIVRRIVRRAERCVR